MISSKLRLLFSIILTIAILVTPFFTPGVRNAYADDSSKILICIDPGHGGKDRGTTGPTGVLEKDVNLDIALRLKNKLVDAGFKVIMTRESDINHSLDEITDFANSNNADLFISIHNNSHPSVEMNGTQTFFYNQSSSGNLLAACISAKTIEQIGTVNRGIKSSNFKVLKNTKMVSALIEGVFMNNPNEEAELKDDNFRDKIATGIYDGIIEYLKACGKNILSAKELASARAFVKRVYQRCLNTDPDQATIDNWADKLAVGKISHADVISDIIASKQFNSRNLTDTQYVDVLYKAVLDRDPDSNGAAYWVSQLKVVTRKTVLNDFLSSDEYKSLVNQYIQNGYTYTGTVDSIASETIVAEDKVSESETVFSLAILNGAGVKGIAAKASELFKEIKYSSGKDKYNISMVADANSYNYKNTQIICKSKDSGIVKTAEEIKSILKVGVITTQNGNSQDSDIVVIIGKDYSTATVEEAYSTTSSENPGMILVNILNGQGTQGIAALAKSSIEVAFGNDKNILKITETKNADNFNYKKTRIIIFTTKAGIDKIADDLKKLIGVGEISKSANNVDNVDITIIIGSDYKK
jgi:N-acetylmuramoyl-L-alanine amidase CwlD